MANNEPKTNNSLKSFVKAANHVLDKESGVVTRAMLNHSAGIILLSGGEFGWILSAEWGTGVFMARTEDADGKTVWSAPMAVTIDSVGVGVVAGGMRKDVIIVLSHAATEELLKGKGQIKFGGELGLAIGLGASAAAEIDVNKKGLGASLVYTFNEGIFVGAEITVGGIKLVDKVNQEFYGTSDPREIVAKEVIPEGSGVPELVQRIKTEMKH